MPHDPLSALKTLESRFDRWIPRPLRLAALLGSGRAARRHHALGQAAFFTLLARGQLRAIRRRREGGGSAEPLLADLALYRRQIRRWRRLAQNDAESPPSTVSTWPLT